MEIVKNQKIRQSNNLIESPYAQDFSAHEIKIFEIAAAGVTSEDTIKVSQFSNKKFTLTSSQLATLLDTSLSVVSHEIEKTAKRIMKKTIYLRKVLEDGSVEFEMINIIPFAKYKNGILEFDLNYAIIPYLIEINRNFTEYQLDYLLSMRSAYAIKLYKLLYQYKNIKARSFHLLELKEQFGIVGKYAQYKDFRKYVIDPSVGQINELTDLMVSYTEIKFGRKIGKIDFNFEIRNQRPQTKMLHAKNIIEESFSSVILDEMNINLPNIDKLLGMIANQVSSATKQLILRSYTEKGPDYIEASIRYVKKHAKTNIDKYLSDTLINGWAEVEVKKLADNNNKEQAKVTLLKQKEAKSKLDKEQDALNKTMLECDWNQLPAADKLRYTDYAKHILQNHQQALHVFENLEHTLPLSIFAVTNQKYYDKMKERYIKDYLQIVLDLNQAKI